MKLTDTWRVSGKTYDGFVEALTKLAKQTYVATVKTDEMSLLHLVGVNEVDDGEAMRFSVHSAAQILERRPLMTTLQTKNVLRHGVDESFLRETTERSKLLVRLNGKGQQATDCYFASPRLCRDLGARADLAGDAIYEPTDTRDAYMMSRYVDHPSSATAIVRHDEKGVVHKMFALPSERYHHIDQRILLSMISSLEEELGTAVCDAWEITHFITRIWLSFPDKADDICGVYALDDKFVPGVLLETSDTGDCSLRAIAYWTGRSHRARIGMYEREHRGVFTEAAIFAQMNNKLMDKYVAFPARMCDLMDIDIPDPVAGLDKMFRMLGVAKLLGKKRAANMLEYMQTEIRSMGTMSAYELAMMMVEIPTRFIGEVGLEAQLEELAGRAPYIDYDAVAKATSSVVLV